MKKIALLLVFTLVLGLSIVLVSCDNKTETTEVESLSAYDVLNADEKIVYSALKKFTSELNDPTSLKLLDIKDEKAGAEEGAKREIYVKISANNAYGSPVAELKTIDGNNFSGCFDFTDRGAHSWGHDGSVAKINAALQEYFDSMGW